MEHVAPAGSMYQAGTLSGNPLAMRAGIETMKILSQPGQARPCRLPMLPCTTSSAPPLPLHSDALKPRRPAAPRPLRPDQPAAPRPHLCHLTFRPLTHPQYEKLDKNTKKLITGILDAGKEAGHAVCGGHISGMLHFSNPHPNPHPNPSP